jgi:hypothetical protein
MIITLDIPEGLASELAAEAQRLGLPLGDYVVTLLVTGRSTASAPKTGAELVAYWQEQGVVGSRPDIADSQSHARELRRQVEQRARDAAPTVLTSEASLAKDWLRPEEDEAWRDL